MVKTTQKKIPDIVDRINELMKYETAGDPMSNLKWTRKTTQKIAKELNLIGIEVSKTSVGNILKKLDYSLKTNIKTISRTCKRQKVEKAKEKRQKGRAKLTFRDHMLIIPKP